MATTSPQNGITILLVTDTLFDTNGVSRFIHDMAAQAREKGENFRVMTSSPLPEAQSFENIINVRPLLKMRMPFYREQYLILAPPLLSFWRHIRHIRPDVIHISTPGPLGWSALLLARMMGIPTSATYHTDFPAYLRDNLSQPLAGRITAWVMRRFYKRMGIVFSRSKRYEAVLQNDVKIPVERIVTLRSGSDLKRFNPSFRDLAVWDDFGIRRESLKLLYVGRLSVEKRFDWLLQVLESLLETWHGEVDVIAVGQGETPATHHPKIHFLGRQSGETLSKIYASSDIFVFASTTETLGQVVMEAQASGLCAVVSNEGGVCEIVEDQVSGYQLDARDAQAWKTHLARLLEDAALRKRMGDAGLQIMQNRTISESFKDFMEQHHRRYM